jgi:hypothetical protein
MLVRADRRPGKAGDISMQPAVAGEFFVESDMEDFFHAALPGSPRVPGAVG